MNSSKQYFSAKEAAAVWRVHPKTVQRWVRLGMVRCQRAGGTGHIRIHVSDVYKGRDGDRQPIFTN